MRILLAVAAIAAAPFAVPVAQAQDSDTSVATPAAAPATAPDGTRAFGIEPYIDRKSVV